MGKAACETNSAGEIPLSVLVVDDHQMNRFVAAELLTQMGYRVLTACHGAEAVEVVRSRPVDVILMDLLMPVMDGITATLVIRALPPPARDIPIVAVSASTEKAEWERCKQAGMNMHVFKPLDKACLAAALKLVQSPAEAAADPAEPPQRCPACGLPFDEQRLQELRDEFGEAAFARFIQLFLTDAHAIAGRLTQRATTRLSSRELRTLSHNLRSASGFLGLHALSQLAGSIERASSSKAAGGLDSLLTHLPPMLAEAESNLKGFLQG